MVGANVAVADARAPDPGEPTPAPCSLRELLRYFLRLGALGFGGPIALAGYMQRDLVEERRWFTPTDYKEALALSQLSPGPLAAQLAMYLGWVRAGALGAFLVGVAFVLPSFVMVLWKGATVAVDLRSRAIVATWPNGCQDSRGIALDEPRGWLFAGCSEGAAVVLDVTRAGAQLSKVTAGSGVDVIDYSPALGHLYLPGAKSATMAILGVSPEGQLEVLGTAPTAPGAHCVAADASGNAYVCDPDRGQLLKYHDPYPATRP